MATTTNRFLEEYTVKIPVVQRDYVQGSDLNAGKRDGFVKRLLDSLATRTPERLHFIYGSIEKTNEYIPFDGQQRLTTLTLIGWLLLQHYRLNPKPGPDMTAQWARTLGMTYEVRDSSKMFADRLMEMRVPAWDFVPSQLIRRQIWYAESWSYDPTIKAMLEMLDFAKAELAGYDDISAMAETFFTDSPIEFEQTSLGLKTRRQMDDLYIKINARGKYLTEFENWKAHFIEMIDRHHGEERRRYFETKIDGDWCDFFWQYCDKTHDAPRIDEYFMRFYNYVTRLLCAWRGITHDFSAIDMEGKRLEIGDWLYSSAENLELLFDALNVATTLGEDFFSRLLFVSNKPKDPNIRVEKRVNIFEADGVNILDSVIRGKSLSLRLELLLWGIIKYKKSSPGNSPLEFIRQWWKYLMNVRQRDAHDFKVNSNLRYPETGDYMTQLESLLAGFNPKEPGRDVISLQNHPWVLYDVHNFERLLRLNSLPDGRVYDLFFSRFVALPNRDRVRAMIAGGFAGVKVAKQIFSFGLTRNWAYILTGSSREVAPALTAMLRGIDAGIPTERGWLCRFVYDYADQLNCPRFGGFDVQGDYSLFSITNTHQQRRGYKAEPFAYVVAKRMFPRLISGDSEGQNTITHVAGSGREVSISFFNSYARHYGICVRYADGSEGVQMESVDGGWMIRPYDPYADNVLPIPAAVLACYADGKVVAVASGHDQVTQGISLLTRLLSLM